MSARPPRFSFSFAILSLSHFCSCYLSRMRPNLFFKIIEKLLTALGVGLGIGKKHEYKNQRIIYDIRILNHCMAWRSMLKVQTCHQIGTNIIQYDEHNESFSCSPFKIWPKKRLILILIWAGWIPLVHKSVPISQSFSQSKRWQFVLSDSCKSEAIFIRKNKDENDNLNTIFTVFTRAHSVFWVYNVFPITANTSCELLPVRELQVLSEISLIVRQYWTVAARTSLASRFPSTEKIFGSSALQKLLRALNS